MNKPGFIILFLIISSLLCAQIELEFSAAPLFGCDSATVTFTNNSTTTVPSPVWKWDFGNGDTSGAFNPPPVNYMPGIYTVTLLLFDAGAPDDTVGIGVKENYIIVRQRPSADFSYSSPFASFEYILDDESIKHDSLEYYYTINFGDETVISDSLKNNSEAVFKCIHNYAVEGVYTINYIISAGQNCADTAIRIIDVGDTLVIPNVFTPNGDEINDLYSIISNGKRKMDFTVYNRWGNIVFQMKAEKIIWDGRTPAGVPVRDGMYFYVLKYGEEGKGEQIKNGTIHIIK